MAKSKPSTSGGRTSKSAAPIAAKASSGKKPMPAQRTAYASALTKAPSQAAKKPPIAAKAKAKAKR
jgi:hypothetical protein